MNQITHLLQLLTFLVISHVTFAQSILQGTVTDSDNTALEAAHIVNLSGATHAHSNHLGKFSLADVAAGDSIRVNFFGYEPVIIQVKDVAQELTIQLNEKSISLDEVVISPTIHALNILADINLKTNPVNSSQELLRKVPGLVIGQHAGGGKAEQIFLRGFDIDHGTDINITVDGMPVNMVSHAHGQGYADLHFLIPEAIDGISFGKGPYNADQGNFATAGYVGFKTKDKLENSLLRVEAGQFNTQRLLGMVNLVSEENHNAYVGLEHISTDGPFESSQNFSRLNIMGKYTGTLANNDKLRVSASHFTSSWDASGQVPQRAIDDGSITRFGAIDDTEGGSTSRSNIILSYDKMLDNQSFIKNTLYISQYEFELFSNFTFFLEDPVNGDQIRQYERRSMFGMQSEYNSTFDMGRTEVLLQAGIGFRKDLSDDNTLSHTVNRLETLSYIQRGDINETNTFGYVNAEFDFGKFVLNPALRVDHFNYQYYDKLLPEYQTQATTASIVSPKLNILYNANDRLQIYLKGGKGFHANDTRVSVAQNGQNVLPAAYGSDAGFIWKPSKQLIVNAAYWYLWLDQEFVYVGDAGIVEPSGKTRRHGFETSIRYQPASWLFFDVDGNYTIARAVEEESGNNFIPLAPDFTLMAGATVIHPSGLYAGARVRHLDNRPANEDNSIVAEGYTVVDANIGYQWKSLDFGISVQNLLNTEWNETQFATESRLQNELEPVEEIHFTPGTPFFLKASVGYRF